MSCRISTSLIQTLRRNGFEAEGRNGRIDHAWLERDGTVYDATTDRLYSFAEYETLFRAAVRVRYTVKEAARRVVESGHYGPWSDTD
jgi:hypothetical protein